MARFMIHRLQNEDWRECVARYGRRGGFECETIEEYDTMVRNGFKEIDAALAACQLWGVADKITLH